MFPRRSEHRFAYTRYSSDSTESNASVPMFPTLDNSLTRARAVLPSLKLKQKPKRSFGGNRSQLRSTMWPNKENQKPLVTPHSNASHRERNLSFLKERRFVSPKPWIVGKSILGRQVDDHPRTIGTPTTAIKTRRVELLSQKTPKLSLKPRGKSIGIVSTPSNNEENRDSRNLPYLF